MAEIRLNQLAAAAEPRRLAHALPSRPCRHKPHLAVDFGVRGRGGGLGHWTARLGLILLFICLHAPPPIATTFPSGPIPNRGAAARIASATKDCARCP